MINSLPNENSDEINHTSPNFNPTDSYFDRQRIDAELNRDIMKWKVRRRLTKSSFYMNIIITLFYLIAPLFISDDQMKKLSEFSSIIITMISFNSATVLAYIGAQSWVQNNEDKIFNSRHLTGSKMLPK